MDRTRRRKGTQTSSFGTSGRIGHNSAKFYAGRLYDGLPTESRVHLRGEHTARRAW